MHTLKGHLCSVHTTALKGLCRHSLVFPETVTEVVRLYLRLPNTHNAWQIRASQTVRSPLKRKHGSRRVKVGTTVDCGEAKVCLTSYSAQGVKWQNSNQ